MSKVSVKVSERDERDWSEDEALVGLQTSPKPPPFAPERPEEPGAADPLAEAPLTPA